MSLRDDQPTRCVDPRLYTRTSEFLSAEDDERARLCSEEGLATYLHQCKEYETDLGSAVSSTMQLLKAADDDSSDDEDIVDAMRKGGEAKAAKLLKKMHTMCFDFVATHDLSVTKDDGSGFKTTEELNLLTDLMELNISEQLKQLSASAVGEVVPYAVSIIGANMSETYSERHISVVNQILTVKRTRLGDEMLEKLAVLRMNRTFMRRMKAAFPTLSLRLSKYHMRNL